MRVRLYQIDPNRDAKGALFVGLRGLQKRGLGVDESIYDLTDEMEIDTESLEEVYAQDQREPHFGRRSLSVGDVVEVVDASHTPRGCYFCDSYGWAVIPFATDRFYIGEGDAHNESKNED